MEIVKCKPWGKDQGDYVLVNKSDVEANPKQYVALNEKELADLENKENGLTELEQRADEEAEASRKKSKK